MQVNHVLHYLYSVVFLMRRLIYVTLIVSLNENPVLFSFALILLNMAFILYIITTRPHDTQISLLVELSNEIMLQIISYHLLCTGFRNSFRKWIDGSEKAVENEETLKFDERLGQSMITLIVLL